MFLQTLSFNTHGKPELINFLPLFKFFASTLVCFQSPECNMEVHTTFAFPQVNLSSDLKIKVMLCDAMIFVNARSVIRAFHDKKTIPHNSMNHN